MQAGLLWDSTMIREQEKRRIILVCLVAISVFSSLHVLNGLSWGHDLNYHLYRIAGLAEGIKSGQLPVRFSYSQLNGMGYLDPLYYGDLLLYFPALLVTLGLSVSRAYRAFVIVVNCLTCVSSYVFAKRFTRSRSTGMAASVVWTLAPYRLVDVYLRAAVGEYLGLLFFPVVLYGLWCAFSSTGRDTTRVHPALWLTLGMSGIVLSHVLSVVLAAVGLVGVFLLLLISGDRRKDGLLCLLSSFLLTLLVCASFIGPLVEQLASGSVSNGTSYKTSPSYLAANSPTIGWVLSIMVPMRGMSPVRGTSVAGSMPVNLGLAFDVVIATLIGLLVMKRKTKFPNARDKNSSLCQEQVGTALLVFAFIFIGLACTPGFWEIPSLIIKALCTVQFPWRLIGPSAVFAVVCMCISANLIMAYSGRTAQSLFVAVVSVLALIESGYMLTTYVQENGLVPEIVEVNADLNTVASGISGGEYLPSNADLGSIESLAVNVGCLQGYEGDGYSISYSNDQRGRVFTVSCDGSSSKIVLPLTWCDYHHLSGVDSATLTQSDDGLVLVELPEAKSCTLTIRFEPPRRWIIYDMLSIAGLVVCLFAKLQSTKMESLKSV